MTVHRHRHGGCPTGLAAAARRRPSAPASAETLPPSKQMKSKLFSTVTAEGAEQGIPSYFNDSRKKQQQLHTAGVQGRGRGSTPPAPGCSQAGMGSGSWEGVRLRLGKQLREFARCGGRAALLWGVSEAGSRKQWKSQERHVPNSYPAKRRTSSTLPHAFVSRAEVLLAPTPKTLKNHQGKEWCLPRALSECFLK